jgi:hypothetical protein
MAPAAAAAEEEAPAALEAQLAALQRELRAKQAELDVGRADLAQRQDMLRYAAGALPGLARAQPGPCAPGAPCAARLSNELSSFNAYVLSCVNDCSLARQLACVACMHILQSPARN